MSKMQQNVCVRTNLVLNPHKSTHFLKPENGENLPFLATGFYIEPTQKL